MKEIRTKIYGDMVCFYDEVGTLLATLPREVHNWLIAKLQEELNQKDKVIQVLAEEVADGLAGYCPNDYEICCGSEHEHEWHHNDVKCWIEWAEARAKEEDK